MPGLKLTSSLAAIAAALLAIAAACGGGGGESSPTGSASATVGATTPTPITTVTPEAIDGVEVVPLQVGEEAEIPENVALIIETGCWQCDGPTTGLYRLYRDSSGQLRTDALFTIEALGIPLHRGNHEEAWANESYITGLALNGDASEIIAGVCTRGYCGGLGWATPDAQTTLFRSLDGGVTWEQYGIVDGGYYVVAITNDGVLWSRQQSEIDQPAPPGFEFFPSGDPLEPPSAAIEAWPTSLPDGELVWPTSDGRLLRSDGSEILALDKGGHVGSVVAQAGGERFAIASWTERTSSQYRLDIFARNGRPMNAFSLSDFAFLGGWLDGTHLVGNVVVPQRLLPTPEPGRYVMDFLPAIFDLEAGVAHPLDGPFQQPPLFGRNYVRAVLRGPFARVVDTGSCLNVRAEPSMAADVLACAADSVLLRDTAQTREVDGATWARVVTPAGVEGWASTQYLER